MEYERVITASFSDTEREPLLDTLERIAAGLELGVGPGARHAAWAKDDAAPSAG